MWIDGARGTMMGSSDASTTSFHVDRFPFDEPVELKHAYTFVHAVQSECGPFAYPNNMAISDLVPDLVHQWKGNVLVFKHGTTAAKGIVNMEEQDISLVEAIIKRCVFRAFYNCPLTCRLRVFRDKCKHGPMIVRG
jgi:hypothetical protein